MTPCQATAETAGRPEPCYWSRMDTAQAVDAFSDPFDAPFSQRQYAQEHAIPRSTLGYWLRQEFPAHLHPALVAFFRSAAGLAFLRRLVLALLLVFHHRSPCGIRPIGLFLELVELDHFVASSYGALYHLDQHLQDDLNLFVQEERPRLASDMTAKDIALCCDENFHGCHVCLIGIEPVSNFILVEAYAQQRDSQTWASAITAGIAGLAVNVVELVSDRASGLTRCALNELQVHYQPEVFHLQHDLAKPVVLPLARPVQQAEKDLEKAKQERQRLEQAEQQQPCSVDLETMLEVVRKEVQAQQTLEQARQKRDQAVEAIATVSEVYHPFDRETAQPVNAEQMQSRLTAPLQRLQQVIEEAGLGERAHQAVRKAHEWVVLLVGGIAWFWTMMQSRVEELELSEEGQRLFQEYLVAGYYWQAASQREKDPAERKRLAERAEQLLQRAWAAGGALAALREEEKKEVQRVAQQCAGLFSRSSSCVEGRNGRLSLFHHGQTRLSGKRLMALTAVHNYVVRRQDGTTAAERFFGKKQRDAFGWLLQRMPELPRPAAKRRKPGEEAA